MAAAETNALEISTGRFSRARIPRAQGPAGHGPRLMGRRGQLNAAPRRRFFPEPMGRLGRGLVAAYAVHQTLVIGGIGASTPSTMAFPVVNSPVVKAPGIGQAAPVSLPSMPLRAAETVVYVDVPSTVMPPSVLMLW